MPMNPETAASASSWLDPRVTEWSCARSWTVRSRNNLFRSRGWNNLSGDRCWLGEVTRGRSAIAFGWCPRRRGASLQLRSRSARAGCARPYVEAEARHWERAMQGSWKRRGPGADRPFIFVIDDDPSALAGLLDALARRFGGDYRVVPHFSAPRRSPIWTGRRRGRGGRADHRRSMDAGDDRASNCCAGAHAHRPDAPSARCSSPGATAAPRRRSSRAARSASSTTTCSSPGRRPRCICIRR